MLGHVLGIVLVVTALSFSFFSEYFAFGSDDQSFTVLFDKTQYLSNDNLTISGEILEMRMPVIAMSIYDPDGKILSANNLEISSEQTFSKTISLGPPFYEKTGKYIVKLDYGQISEKHSFVIVANNDDKENKDQSDSQKNESKKSEIKEDPKIISLYTEKKQYTDNDTILIKGQVSSLESPTVLIGIYDTFGTPAGFYFGMIDSDLEFSTSFLVKSGVNFKVDGTYSIKAHYAESEAVSSFEYSKEKPIQPKSEDISQKTNEQKTDDTNDELSNKNKSKTDDKLSSKSSQSSVSAVSNTDKSSSSTNMEKTTNQKNSVSDNTSTTKGNNDNSIIEKENILTTPNDSNDDYIKQTKNSEETSKQTIVKENASKSNPDKTKTKKHSNLSVEDIELGKLLNQINLACDPSPLTDTISYYDGMGPALYRLCKFDSSLDSFNKSLIENPNNVEVLVNKGSALGKMRFFSEAIVYYDQAIKIDPEFLPAKNNKANALVNMGNYRDAILLYNEVLVENPNYVTARTNLEIVLSEKLPDNLTSTISFEGSKYATDNAKTPVVSDGVNYSPSNPIVQINSTDNGKQKPANFLEEVGLAFSSLFGFLGN